MLLHLVLLASAFHWTPQVSQTAAGLRGLCVVSSKVAWASGTNGTVLRTIDSGLHWELRTVPGAELLDFRDVEAFDSNTALAMSSGPGESSRVYSTNDGGNSWTVVLRNPDKSGFFDAVKFWNRKDGILLGDPVDGRFTIYTTQDGGLTWRRAIQPAALAGEGAFAASGTCLTVRGTREAWFGTGGPGVARVFHTADGAKTWTVAATPMYGSTAATGIFSLVFIDGKHGVTVGGDYQKPAQTSHTLAFTGDAGENWRLGANNPGGYRSAVTYLKRRHILIAAGTNGSDYSLDGGKSWSAISNDNLNSLAAHGDSVWAVGPKGSIMKWDFDHFGNR